MELGDRDAAQGGDGLADRPARLKHVAEHQDDGEAQPAPGHTAERTAGDQSIVVHPIQAAAPGSLRHRDHAPLGPRGEFDAPWMRVEAIGLLLIYNRILTLRSVRSPVVPEHVCTLFTHSLNV